MSVYGEFVETVRERLEAKNISLRAAALGAGLPVRSVQGVIEGHVPSIERAAEIASALGLEFYIGPPRDGAPAAAPEDRFDRFDPDIDLPVRGWAKCSMFGHLEDEKEYPDLPMPEGVGERNADSFYAMAKGLSMRPEGIEPGDYCLVSPNTPLAIGMRAWLKDRQGRSVIKRLMADDDKICGLRGWQEPDARGRQTAYDEEWMKLNIAAQGVVLAVYRGRPDAENPPPLIPDPNPPPAPAPKEIAEALDLAPGASLEEAIKAIEAKSALDATALREEIVGALKEQTHTLREELAERLSVIPHLSPPAANDLEDVGALAVEATEDGEDVPGARRIDIVEYEAAAGGGAEATEEQVVGTLTFRRNWLDRHGLDATQCTVIAVRGGSMEPTLWEGASILVNRGRTEWRRGRIFVFRTPDGLVVKRAGEDEAGERVLVSDNPEHRMTPCPDDAEIIGQVAWTARTLLGA